MLPLNRQRTQPGMAETLEIEELTTQVKYLTKEVAQLRGERPDRRQRGPVCWGCRERGHLRRNCPKQRKQQDRKQPLN